MADTDEILAQYVQTALLEAQQALERGDELAVSVKKFYDEHFPKDRRREFFETLVRNAEFEGEYSLDPVSDEITCALTHPERVYNEPQRIGIKSCMALVDDPLKGIAIQMLLASLRKRTPPNKFISHQVGQLNYQIYGSEFMLRGIPNKNQLDYYSNFADMDVWRFQFANGKFTIEEAIGWLAILEKTVADTKPILE
eukprot:GILI01035760.1.p1 GENE.GILI01035760.1~~GILI01035760.1.p1  ORF type:complete len:207 (+),score=34.74 GILI01035760.1:31-621(+)